MHARFCALIGLVLLAGCATTRTTRSGIPYSRRHVSLAQHYMALRAGAPYSGPISLSVGTAANDAGLEVLGAIEFVGPLAQSTEVLQLARNVNAVMLLIIVEGLNYTYTDQQLKWVPGETTSVSGTVTGNDGTRYVSGTARTYGHLETNEVTRYRTLYHQVYVFWGR